MNKRVFRRNYRLDKAVMKSIDRGIDKLWVATGVGSDGRASLKRAGRERDDDVVVVVGRPTFGNVKGSPSAPAKSFVARLSRRFRVLIVGEYRTSKRCDVCGEELQRTRGWSVRYVPSHQSNT